MGFFTSKTKSTQTVDTGPWKVQAPFLQDTFGQAQDLYNTTKAQPGYQGDFYAGLTDQQKGLIDQGINYYGGLATDRANTLYGIATNSLNTGQTGATNAINGLGDFQNSDRIGQILDAANRTANNPYISDMVKASMSDANRQAAESTIPNLYRDAAAGSNLNSSRTALAQGVVERGLAQRAADISANMRGNAYSQGLGIGVQDNAQMLQSLLGQGQLGNTMSALGLNANNLATNQLDSATGKGLGLATMYQQNNQLGLDNDFAKFKYAEDRPYDLLSRYYGIIGANNWGQNGVTQTVGSSTPSGAQIAGSIISTIGSLFGGGGMFGSGGFFGGK